MSEDRDQVRERALGTLESIRTALEASDLQEAISQIDVLQNQLVDWRRADAREWLDNALKNDLLLFNIDAANQRLRQWAVTVSDPDADEDLSRYRKRVTDRTSEKHLELQARGVIAHCNELWRLAHEIEMGDTPPLPEQVIAQYFQPAFEVASSASMEYPDNEKLQALRERAETIYREKQRAADLYLIALREDRFADALDQLEQLALIQTVPRYQVGDPDEQEDAWFSYAGQVMVQTAAEELDRMGRAWAGQHVAQLLQAVHDHLQAYQPQTALDVMARRKRVERFAEAPISEKLQEFEQRANEDLRKLQHAERRAKQAVQVLDENALGAWDIFREAANVYPGAPSLQETRSAIIDQLTNELQGLIADAEEAFNARLMDRIGQIYQGARLDYSDKAPELEDLLSRLEEIDWQARTFREYRGSALEMLEQLRGLVVSDISAAADLLAKLEDLPALVLEDLPGLSEIRAAVRQQLNMEMLYGRVYTLLHSDRVEEVEQGLASIEPYLEDSRFKALADDLETHVNYLNAHVEYAVGQFQRALDLFMRVVDHDGHPDQGEAERMISEIEGELASRRAPEEPDEPESFEE